MSLFMLDTNTASEVIKNIRVVKKHLLQTPISDICISSITKAELIHGAIKKGDAGLTRIVEEFLIRVTVYSFNDETANAYGLLRCACEDEGKSLSEMDMLIAAHSLSVGAILVTNDAAIKNIGHHLHDLEDWS